nr:MAG TPA: tail tape measure protein [Caudoviricetes sp.]
MANLKTEVILSMNGEAAIRVLEALRDKAKAVREEIDNLDKDAPDFKERKAGLESVYKTLQNYQTNIIKDTERLDHALKNLSTTSLQNLRKALGDGRRQLQKLSEDDFAQAEEVRKKMKQVGDEIRLIEGQYVNIAEGLKNVSNQSNQWLDKAIKQQRDLVGSLQKSDASYQQNLATLKQLEAEEDRRKGKMSEAEAHQTVTSQNASASDLRRAKTTLTEARDATPTKLTGNIEAYNNELQEIDKRLEAVSGKAQQATMSWKQMKRVLSEPNKASGEDIKRTMEVIAQKIQQLPAGGKYVATLRRQYAMLEQTLKGTRLSQSALNDILARSKQGKASLDELRRAYKQLEEELNQVNTKSKEFADKQKSMKELKKNIDEATGAVNKHGGAWQTALRNLVAYVGLFGAFNMLKQKLTDAINLNLKYSDSLADIRKITNYSMGTVNELSRMLAKIDSRTSLEGLTQLAYVGSRMGMGKYGAEGLYEFAKASDRVNVALHEDLGDDAMLTLSKFVETMGEVEKHGGNISTAFDSVASSIFKLAASSTSNGNNIFEFAKRLTGLAKVTKVTSAQLLGLASASDSLMLMPEVASTAFGKLLSSLWTNYHSIEKMLGMQRDSLKGMIEEGRTMDALVTVLKNVSDKNLNSMDEYFKEFGSDGQRLKQVVVTMAQNVNVLEQNLDTSNEAYREGTAVVKEYKIQQQTAQAILERANNMWEKAFVNPEGIDSVKEMAKMWYNFSKSLTHSQPFLLSVRFLFVELTIVVRMLLSVLPGLVAYLGTRGLVAVFSKLIPLFTGLKFVTMASNIKLATKAVMGDAWAVRILTLRWQALNAAMKANVIGLVLGVVTSLGFGIYELFSNTEKATGSMKRFDGSLEGVKSQANQAVGELDAYYHAVRDAQKGTNQRTAAIKQFNEKFGSYLSNLITEKSTAKDLAKAYLEAADAIKAKIYLQMKEKDIQEQYTPRVGWSLDRLNEYGKVGKGTDSMDWLKAYEADSRDKGMRSIAKELAKRFKTTNTAEVLKSYFRGDENLRFDYRKTLDRYGNTTLDLTRAGEGDEKLFRALRYIAQTRSANSSMSKINKKFGPVQKEIDDFLTKDDGKNILVDNDNKKTGKGDKNPLPKEKNIAKDRANALIANIKAFYEEQMRKYLEWVAQMNADGEKISEGQQKKQMDYLQSQMDRALGSARQSIATLDDSWKEVYSHMNEDVMVFDDETSKQLLESIGKADVGELHKLFTKLSGDLSRENNKTLAENLGALLDQLFANGSKELREAAEKLLARQREIQKILNEHDYTGAVNRNTRSDFDRLGFLRPADGVNADTPEGLGKMNAAFDKLTAKARESVTVLYSLNPESKEFQHQFLQFLSIANDSFDFSELKAQDLKALYLELIKYSDEYESASKKRDDERKKLNDYAWSKTDFSKGYNMLQPKLEQDAAVKGSYRNVGQCMGMESVSASDPELELLKARMAFAQEYYKFLEEHNATEQQLADARKGIMSEQANYAKKLTVDMFEQYNSLLTFMGPLQTFGESVGDAFATMTENASEGRKQLKSALKQMIKSFATSSLQMISQQQIDRAQTTAHYEQLLLMQQVFAQAKLQAEVANGTAMIGAKQAANLTEEQLEGIHQQVMAALRSAGIFGWCVSTLGPIAGPIAYGAMMATLMGLLNFAISKIGGRDKSTNNTAKANNIKVTSGMLTYDSGNVQGLRPFVSNDGSLYWATEDNKPHRGVSLLTHPTATTINGQPSLVAENGPEIVIGRETTRAMQMNNPQLLRALVNFDRNFSGRKAYDAGNLSEAATADPTGASVQELIANSVMANMALQEAVTTLLKRLDAPIEAKINMYGYGQLYDSMKKAERFMRNK